MLPNQQPLPGPPGADTPSMAPAPGGGAPAAAGAAPPNGGGAGGLGPQDAQVLLTQSSPQAIQVMKRMFDAIFDGIAAKQNAMKGGGGAPAPGAPPAAGPQPGPNGAGGPSPGPGAGGPAPTPVAPGGLPRPGTRLSNMQ